MTAWRLYLLSIFLLPLVEGVLRVRLGAAWELSILIIFILIPVTLITLDPKRAFSLAIAVAGSILLISFVNVVGYITYAHEIRLDESLESQIFSVEARMVVESLRLFACFAMFLITIIYVNTIARAAEALKWFVLGAITQGFYGFYEFLVKTTGLSDAIPLLNDRSAGFSNILRPYGTFYEPSQFGQFMLVSIFMVLILVHLPQLGLRSRDRYFRWRACILALFIVMLALSISRAAFVVAVVVLLGKVAVDVISLSRRRLTNTGQWILVYALVGLAGVGLVAMLVPNELIEAWLFKTFIAGEETLDENTGMARAYSIAENARVVMRHWLAHPFGIGEGMAIMKYGSLAFTFRLAIELGPIPFLGYITLLIYIFARVVAGGALSYPLLPVYFATVLIQFNYNTTNHVWIWFVLALVLALSNLLGSGAPVRQGPRYQVS